MTKKTLLLLTLFFMALGTTIHAQTIETMAGNTLNGAMNGVIIGGATMALAETEDFSHLRIGLGLGILAGVGMGVYDITHSKGGELLVSGLFNDGTNSSIIILLDTFYGAAAGSVIASAVMLVANEPLVKGLQYGSGAGAIAGFGFGIFDSFILAERRYSGAIDPVSGVSINQTKTLNPTQNFASTSGNSTLKLFQPTMISTTFNTDGAFNRKPSLAIDVIRLNISF